MPDANHPNYPDILGTITGGERYNFNVVQAALALRPRVVRAGRPFELLLVVQNASDVTVDFEATIRVPDRDAQKKKGRFVAKAHRLVIGLEAAEVGYVQFPINCLPDTAVSPDYQVSVEVKVTPTDKKKKPRRVREVEGGGKVDLEQVADKSRPLIEDLQRLTWDSAKLSKLRGSVDIPFSVMSGKVGAIADLQPGWTSLWTLKDHMDDRLLLMKYYETMKVKVLPGLNRTTVFEPLLERTKEVFKEGGFELKPSEALLVTKLLTLLLEYAAPAEGDAAHGALAAGIFNILPLLNKERLEDESRPITVPHWVGAMLRALVRDERAAQFPVQAVLHFAYFDLLRDAMDHAFQMIQVATGENLGTDEEIATYCDQCLAIFKSKDGSLDFTHSYMPLVLGGIIVFDRVLTKDEKLGDLLQEMRTIVAGHGRYRDDNTEPIFRIASRLIDQSLMKYGYRS